MMPKVVVIGAGGRIGEKLVENLRKQDCRVVQASRRFGVDAVTGVGLAEALEEAEIVIDVSNSPSLEGADALKFFERSCHMLLSAGRAADVRHHIALSIVGVDGLVSSDYFHAKKIQEELIGTSGIPFTIVRSTQFFEFIADVVQDGTPGEIPISPALVQPIAAEDVADTLACTAFAVPSNHAIEVAGPEQFRLDEVATEIATAYEDGRQVVADVRARYFGAELEERSLLPGPSARIAFRRFDDWVRQSLRPARSSAWVSKFPDRWV
jgi:uncharacterized protein YbjT (DUF2867 family)